MRRRGWVRFNLDVTAPADIDGLTLEALKALVVELLSKAADQERVIAELREENARLKGLNSRPRIKPSGMENASEPKRPGKRGKRRGRGKIAPRVAIEDRVIKAQVPPGSPLSPLLANLYMRRFVLGWKKLGLERSLGTRLVRPEPRRRPPRNNPGRKSNDKQRSPTPC